MNTVPENQLSASAHVQQRPVPFDAATLASPAMQLVPSSSWWGRPIAAVMDWANITVTEGAYRLAVPEKGIVGELRLAGADPIVAAARSFDPKTNRRLRAEGVKTVPYGDNADPLVFYYAAKFLRRGFAVIVVTGDGNLGLSIAAEAAASGAPVAFWSLSERLSHRLTCFPHRILDDIIPVRRRNDWAALTARASGAVH